MISEKEILEVKKRKAYDLLSKLFVYKAEWLEHDMFKLYTQPNYFPEITGIESCVLIGGRGTGKTTVLKGLSYIGQYEQNIGNVNGLDYYGLYYKIESNRVSAFSGSGMSESEWIKSFSHYVNLIVLSLTTDMLIWLENKKYIDSSELENYKWRFLEDLMKWNKIKSFVDLKNKINANINQFENYINNYNKGELVYTILGSPIDYLIDAVSEINLLKGKKIFILLDEYENLSEYQQKIFNTLIKQSSGKNYSFKIGVRELGWKSRVTLNNQELRSPSDYRKIDIQSELEGNFENFATVVCEGRLKILFKELELDIDPVMKNIFTSLVIEEEAEKLGIKKLIKSSNKFLQVSESLSNLHPLYIWFICKWKTNENLSVKQIVSEYKKNVKKWDVRYENYKYSLLFAIRDRKVGIRKFYSGWNTLLLMSNSNIRFTLQLVEACLKIHLNNDGQIGQPVSAEDQTEGAYRIGYSNFEELEGLDINGDSIMQLLQGLGRVFEVLARQPFGHAPEVNQFWINDLQTELLETKSRAISSIQSLLDTSLSHLAIRRSISTKLAVDAPRSFDYSIHPIYSALFQISHRKKRKLTLNSTDIEQLIVNQRIAIERITSKSNRRYSEFDEESESRFSSNSENRNYGSQLEIF